MLNSPRKPELKPYIERIEGDTDLVAPPGCYASVLLKLVHRDDGHRYYSWWAVAGRHGMDAISVPYKYTGEDTIRFDVPEGMPLSAQSLQRHLDAFLEGQQEAEGDTPVIIEK
jgi:hypothetical protein